jgi:glycosyltransferase involved in cell wall biosynthesis
MRFTFPILTLCYGGAQRMLAELVNGLVDRGHQVTILMPKKGDINYAIKARVLRTKQEYTIFPSDYPTGDFIVSNFYSTVPAAESASRSGKGIHVRLSLCYEPTFLPDNSITFPSYHVTRHLIVLSKSQQQLIYINHGILGHIVPVGISSAFRNMKIKKEGDPLQISAIVRKPEGGFSWHREQNYLLNHLEMVKKKYPHVSINLFSPPSEFASSPFLQSLKASNKFRCLTPADDREMNYHYNETDIFVNSSTYDSASLPGLEAMKCGAALVTTYAGGNQDYGKHQQNCLMSYRYQNRLAHDVIRLIENPTLRNNVALEGEKEAKKWTWGKSVTAFEQAITKMIPGR